MSFFDKIQSGVIYKPFFILFYSEPGIGKTDFARSFPDPFFFDFEESTHMINVKRHRPLSFQEILNDLDEIYARPKITEFKSIIFDTADEMERLIHWLVAEDEKKTNIKKVGWNKGYDYAIDYWALLISKCRLIRDKHQIHFIFNAHSQNFNKTDSELEATFNKTTMALNKKAASYLFGQVEMVLYGKKEVAIKHLEEKTFAKDLGTRVMCTQQNVGWDAKNRIGLPSVMPMPFGNGYNVLKEAYEKSKEETPEKVHTECIRLIEKIQEKEDHQSIREFCDSHKENIAMLRMCLEKIKIRVGGNNDTANI